MLLGDIRQLPAQKDSPLYAAEPKQITAKHGKKLIENFHKMLYLTKCHRQQDQNFLHAFDNLSNGCTSTSGNDMLSTRLTTNVGLHERNNFKDALRLFATKDLVNRLADLIDSMEISNLY